MRKTNKYLGTYRIYSPTDNEGKVTRNEDDTYLKARYGIQIFRFDKKTLAIQFLHYSTVNIVQPQLESLGVELRPFLRGEAESVWLFSEKDIHKVASVVNPNTKGAKIKPKSVKTARQVNKKKNIGN